MQRLCKAANDSNRRTQFMRGVSDKILTHFDHFVIGGLVLKNKDHSSMFCLRRRNEIEIEFLALFHSIRLRDRFHSLERQVNELLAFINQTLPPGLDLREFSVY